VPARSVTDAERPAVGYTTAYAISALLKSAFGSTLIRISTSPILLGRKPVAWHARAFLLMLAASHIFLIPFFFLLRETSSIDIGAVIHHDLGQCVFTRDT
jgi:hypothetical protein